MLCKRLQKAVLCINDFTMLFHLCILAGHIIHIHQISSHIHAHLEMFNSGCHSKDKTTVASSVYPIYTPSISDQ